MMHTLFSGVVVMPHPRTMNPEHLVGLPVLDVAGATVGTIESVYLDGHTGVPEWAALTTGMVGGHATLVKPEPSER